MLLSLLLLSLLHQRQGTDAEALLREMWLAGITIALNDDVSQTMRRGRLVASSASDLQVHDWQADYLLPNYKTLQNRGRGVVSGAGTGRTGEPANSCVIGKPASPSVRIPEAGLRNRKNPHSREC